MRDEGREEAELAWLGRAVHHCRRVRKPKPKRKRKHRQRQVMRWKCHFSRPASPASGCTGIQMGDYNFALSASLLNILSIQIQQLPFNAFQQHCVVEDPMELTVAPHPVFVIASWPTTVDTKSLAQFIEATCIAVVWIKLMVSPLQKSRVCLGCELHSSRSRTISMPNCFSMVPSLWWPNTRKNCDRDARARCSAATPLSEQHLLESLLDNGRISHHHRRRVSLLDTPDVSTHHVGHKLQRTDNQARRAIHKSHRGEQIFASISRRSRRG